MDACERDYISENFTSLLLEFTHEIMSVGRWENSSNEWREDFLVKIVKNRTIDVCPSLQCGFHCNKLIKLAINYVR